LAAKSLSSVLSTFENSKKKENIGLLSRDECLSAKAMNCQISSAFGIESLLRVLAFHLKKGQLAL
jgi:hypothetical protein